MRRSIFTDDHEALRATAREFVAREVTPRLDDFIAAHAFPRDLWKTAGAQGLLGLQVPEEYGGGGAADDYRFTAVVVEELAAASLALATCVGIHADTCAPYLVGLTTEEQCRRWLPGYAAGELVAAIAMTEPGGGSDLAALTTSAVRDGDGWVLDGSKTFITNGYGADLVIVAARTAPERGAKGISLFVVESGMAGFSRGRKLDKVGQEEADTSELFFDRVRLGPGQLIGVENEGFKHLMTHLAQERLGSAVTDLAHVRAVLGETIEYAKARRAFGRPIGSHQYNKFVIAELVTRLDVAQAFVDAAVLEHVAGRLTPVDAAKAKWWAAQVQNDLLDACVQLHGGYGYMNEYRVARAWRDARVTKIWAGSNEIMKEIIGRDLGL